MKVPLVYRIAYIVSYLLPCSWLHHIERCVQHAHAICSERHNPVLTGCSVQDSPLLKKLTTEMSLRGQGPTGRVLPDGRIAFDLNLNDDTTPHEATTR